MREFIFIDSYGETVKAVWNPDSVVLHFDREHRGTLTVDGKEALKLINWFLSL